MDNLSKEQRHRNMAAIRGKDTKPEENSFSAGASAIGSTIYVCPVILIWYSANTVRPSL